MATARPEERKKKSTAGESEAHNADPPKPPFKLSKRLKKGFSHRDAQRACRRAALRDAPAKPNQLTDLEWQYLLVTALQPELRPQVILGRRYYTPKPSAEAEVWIVSAIRTILVERAEREGWTGDGVSVRELLQHPNCELSAMTLRIYLGKLVKSNVLHRCRRGRYQLPPLKSKNTPQ